MHLTLTCLALSSSHTFGPEGGTFGRSKKCDWTLPDDQRILSSVHGRIFLRGGEFILVDESTNGIIMGGQANPLGRGNSASLLGGTRFKAGPFEFEARIEAGTADSAVPTFDNPLAMPAAAGAVAPQQSTKAYPGAPQTGVAPADPLHYLDGGAVRPTSNDLLDSIPNPVPPSAPPLAPAAAPPVVPLRSRRRLPHHRCRSHLRSLRQLPPTRRLTLWQRSSISCPPI